MTEADICHLTDTDFTSKNPEQMLVRDLNAAWIAFPPRHPALMASVSPTLGPFLLYEFSIVVNMTSPALVFGARLAPSPSEWAVIGDREIDNAPA